MLSGRAGVEGRIKGLWIGSEGHQWEGAVGQE